MKAGRSGYIALCIGVAGLYGVLSPAAVAAATPPGVCSGPWMGVTLDAQGSGLGPGLGGGTGVRIAQVDPDGPAAVAGLHPGDLIQAAGAVAVRSPDDVAGALALALPGDTLVLAIVRAGTAIGPVPLELWGVPRAVCHQRLADPDQQGDGAAPSMHNPMGPGRADGLKALVSVGAIQVKAQGATAAIGDGLREMLVSALHESGYLIVVDRSDPQAQRTGLEVADILVLGAVTEFEPNAGGSSFMTPMVGVPLAMGAQIRWAQMALDIRVVDVQTARVLAAQRIPGMARSAQATLAGALPVGPISVPAGLSVYRNTPMEWAVRDCLRKAAYFVINSVDDSYFRQR